MITQKWILFIIATLLCLQVHAEWPWKSAADQVKNGMTEQELRSTLGEPKGVISGGSKKTLMYDGVQIEVLNGEVINLPDDFSTQYKDGKKKHAKQKKTTLLTTKISKSTPTKKPPKNIYVMKGKDNRPIDHRRYTRSGAVTVVDFYADWCGPCKTLAPELDKLIRSHRGVALTKVNIGTWGSSIAEHYNVTSVPNVRVFDRKGNMIGPPTSNLSKIDTYIRQAKK
jgi:thiol-disulfide isomerase/thioredoxin